MKHGTVGFVSGSWLRFGARAVHQGPSLFLSSPFIACDTKAKSSVAFATGFTKAAEHPSHHPMGDTGGNEPLAGSCHPCHPACEGLRFGTWGERMEGATGERASWSCTVAGK